MAKQITLTLHDAKKERPEQSGDYWCFMLHGFDLTPTSVMRMFYSKKHNAFNALDFERKPKSAIPVDYWAQPITEGALKALFEDESEAAGLDEG